MLNIPMYCIVWSIFILGFGFQGSHVAYPRVISESAKISFMAIISRAVQVRPWKFYMILFITTVTLEKKFSVNSGQLGFGLIRSRVNIDSSTPNALPWPITTELSTLRPIFGIRRQNCIRNVKNLTALGQTFFNRKLSILKLITDNLYLGVYCPWRWYLPTFAEANKIYIKGQINATCSRWIRFKYARRKGEDSLF